MEPVIKSLLDNDLYKSSMMNYVMQLFPTTEVTYKFKNRGKQRFNQKFLTELQKQIVYMENLKLTEEEYQWMKENIPYFPISYFEYLKNFRYNPANISVKLTKDNNLELEIKGSWLENILWEVPIMAIISELYFKLIDINWDNDGQEEKAKEKISKLSENGCNFVDMGSRRRRSFYTQDMIIRTFVDYSRNNTNNSFLGTSNVFFAKKYNLTCYGSQAHEITQAAQATNSYNLCNYYSMENWFSVYPDLQIGTALSDTITVDMFLKDFNKKLSTLYGSVRHDSGDPFTFIGKMIKHYEGMGINPREKMIIFSDGLSVSKAISIKEYCERKIKCSFGIGTHFSNNGFNNSPALNMVIKLWSVNDMPVVKLGDEGVGKENGDIKAVAFMRWLVEHSV